MTQKEKIFNHLKEGKSISPIEALNLYGCFRLGARIWEFRQQGYDIKNIGTDEGNYAVYKLIPKKTDNSIHGFSPFAPKKQENSLLI